MVDVESLGALEGANLRGCAAEAVLGSGDALFLPAYWFHHVHALDGEGVSLSLWYQHEQTLAEGVACANRAMRHTLRVRVARESEEVVGALIGPRHVRAFFVRLAWYCEPGGERSATSKRTKRVARPPVDYNGDGEDEAAEMEAQLQVWLLHRLGTLLGQSEVIGFVRLYLSEKRFTGDGS